MILNLMESGLKLREDTVAHHAHVPLSGPIYFSVYLYCCLLLRTLNVVFGLNRHVLTRNTCNYEISIQNLSNVDIFKKSDTVANIWHNPKYRSHKIEAYNFNIYKIVKLALKLKKTCPSPF